MLRADEVPHAESAKRWPRVERIIERARIGIKEIDHIQCAIAERAAFEQPPRNALLLGHCSPFSGDSGPKF
ncbi:hypothetical protein [Bradyrhizobium sp. CCGUVB23]|uniref:hypothetical protein n=1 Tax=Bradyrhizobium sp. CCGUVB23 TaxID=2949630 RepID=UPI0020B3429A|nr:hypothetical protein [Bradyrhizobium sp. CCGUVB23]MCP3460937.1 hypothetical protein [Bradyrhizobium sp. CCGUVB23]